MEPASACLSIAGQIATLYRVLQEIESAKSSLATLSRDAEDARNELELFQEYLLRAELSRSQQRKFEASIRSVEVRVNTLIDVLESIIQQLKDTPVRKARQKLRLVNGEHNSIKENLNAVTQSLSSMRQKLLTEILLSCKDVQRREMKQMRERIAALEVNTNDTDACLKRQTYQNCAQEFGMKDYIVYPPAYSPPRVSTPPVISRSLGNSIGAGSRFTGYPSPPTSPTPYPRYKEAPIPSVQDETPPTSQEKHFSFLGTSRSI